MKTNEIGVENCWFVKFNPQSAEYEWVMEIVNHSKTHEKWLESILEEVRWINLSIKDKIKELKNRLYNFQQETRAIKNQINKSPKEAWFLEMRLDNIEHEKLVVQKQINRYMWDELPTADKKTLDIGRAKSVPITNFLEFNRAGFTKCLWHDDSNPSMKLDKRRGKLHCFVCGADKDVIDLVQALENIDFPTAVKKLTHQI